VNKSELIDIIATQAEISKAAAGRAVDSAIGAITKSLKKGDDVTLVGFGTFSVTKRAKVPKFRPGKALKDAVN
jgi:DNA-binding protein HU-beta